MKFRKKNYDLRIVLGASLILSTLLIAFEKSHDLGVNLFTEIVGVAITVFVINKILERKERQKRVSIDQRIFKEIQFIIASYFSIWKHLAWQFLPNERINTVTDLLRLYPELVRQSVINKQFAVISIHYPESWKLFFHHRTVKECFENYYNMLTEEIQWFVNDYKIYLEPELLDKLLSIMESQYFKNILMMGQEGTDKILLELGEDVNKLESYLSPEDMSHLNQFMELMTYSTNLKNAINQFTDAEIELYEIKKYFVHPSQSLYSSPKTI